MITHSWVDETDLFRDRLWIMHETSFQLGDRWYAVRSRFPVLSSWQLETGRARHHHHITVCGHLLERPGTVIPEEWMEDA